MVVVVRNGSELDGESSVRNNLAGSNPVFHPKLYMVIVAELVKPLVVVQVIVGSSPTFHTKKGEVTQR
jgi:hypothetical protein